MQIALTGLPQSGKTALFTAMNDGHEAPPSGAHQLSRAIVKVPDGRLDVLAQMYKPKKVTHATLEFLDLPGLNFAEESGRHEARRIIAEARQADMIVVVVSDFHNDAVAAYRDRVDPASDIDELTSEFLLADMELIGNRIEKLEASVKKPTPKAKQDQHELDLMKRFQAAVDELQPLSSVAANPEEAKLVRSFGFLTLKPMVIVVNVDEDRIGQAVSLDAAGLGGDVLSLCVSVEAELAALDADERQAFLEDMGITEIARDRLIRQCYDTLKLRSFLTAGEDEVRAWTIPAGCHAVEAAGEIHSDIQRGFIRAETVHYDDLMAAGDMKGAKAAGKVRLEGKTYEVLDGDIINFRFNV